MFGYVTANELELKVKEFRKYKAYYCGLCQILKNKYGFIGQLTLTYDMTFAILLLTSLYESDTKTDEFRCMVHPVKKVKILQNEITEYAAAMNLILAYHNLADDWKDDRSYAKKALVKILDKDYARIVAKYPRQAKALEHYMEQMESLERQKESNLDLVSGLSGEMLGEIFCWKEDVWTEELKTLGFYMGKFIYLMDAYEDFEKDKKKNAYNPLKYMKIDGNHDFETICRLLLTSMVAECAKSFERLPILLHADILRNVLYSGVWTKYEYLQLKKRKLEEKRK